MSNAENDRRMESAQRMATLFREQAGAQAILVMGSVSRGEADTISDVDMALYYETLPPMEVLHSIREQVGGSPDVFHVGSPEEGGFAHGYRIDGIKHDFAHSTFAFHEQCVAEVLETHQAESPMQKVLEGILDGVPLYGEARIAAWKEQARQYPQALREAMVKKHLRFYPPWVGERMALGRGDRIFFAEIAVEATRNLLGILCGLNRLYHWGELKHMDAKIARMTLAPSDLAARLQTVLSGEPERAARELDTLIRETFALLEVHLPQVDSAAARQRYALPPSG